MKFHLLPALALSGLVATTIPAGGALAQSRADAEAALTRMGLLGRESDTFRYERADWSEGRYILSGVVVTDLDVDSKDVDLDTAGEMRIERMIFEAPRIDASDDVVFDGLAIEGLSMTEPDSDGFVRLAHLAVEGPNAVMAADLARMISGDDDFEPDWSAYRFDALGFEGFDAEGDGEEGPYDVAVEEFVLQDYGDIELGRMALMGVAVEATAENGPASFRLDELTLTGFRSSAYSELMETIAAGGDEDAVMDAYYRTAFTPQLDLFDRFTLRGLAGEAEGVAFAVDNLVGSVDKTGSRYAYSVGLDSARLVPDASQPAGAQVATALGMLGYEQVEMSLAANSVYDESTGRARTVGDNFIELHDGLRIEMTQDLGGYNEYYAALPAAAEALQGAAEDEEATAEQADAMMKLMAPIVLHDLSMRIVDLSLLDRALEAGAASQGITTEELRMQTAAMIGVGLLSAPPDVPRPLLAQLSEALTAFINQGGSLTVRATPPDPISIGVITDQIEAGTFDYNALGLSFTADAPE